jgi:hypothetical protein
MNLRNAHFRKLRRQGRRFSKGLIKQVGDEKVVMNFYTWTFSDLATSKAARPKMAGFVPLKV